MKNGQSFSQIIKTVTYTVNMIWTYKKSYIFIKIFLMLFNSVIPLASVLLPGYIINEMTVDRRLNIVFSYVAILISVPVLQFIVNSIFNRIVGRQEFELNLEFQSRFLSIFPEWITRRWKALRFRICRVGQEIPWDLCSLL